jgi:hypothetical protein
LSCPSSSGGPLPQGIRRTDFASSSRPRCAARRGRSVRGCGPLAHVPPKWIPIRRQGHPQPTSKLKWLARALSRVRRDDPACVARGLACGCAPIRSGLMPKPVAAGDHPKELFSVSLAFAAFHSYITSNQAHSFSPHSDRSASARRGQRDVACTPRCCERMPVLRCAATTNQDGRIQSVRASRADGLVNLTGEYSYFTAVGSPYRVTGPSLLFGLARLLLNQQKE